MARTHGLPWTYIHGCRCGLCTEANTIRHQGLRQELAARPYEDVPHGTHSGYSNWGCRCAACTSAQSVKNALGRARRKRRQGRRLSELEQAALAQAGGL